MIDDVDFLLKNSTEQSVTVYVDSGLRNKLYYPYPNSYTITFEQPIKNVFGFEILDGSIPNSMYNVDIYNNDFYLTVVTTSQTSVEKINPQVFMSELSTSKTFIDLFNTKDASYVIVGIYEDLNQYININNANANYQMFLRKSIASAPIIHHTTQIENEYYFFKYINNNYAITINTENQSAIQILKTGDFHMNLNIDGTYEIVYFNIHIINMEAFNQINTSGLFLISVNNEHIHFTTGNYDIVSITSNLGDLLNNYGIEVQPTTQPPILKASMSFTSNKFFLLNTAKGKLLQSLGFDSYPSFTTTGHNFNAWTIGENQQVFGATIDPEITNGTGYIVTSPGIINLTGERFCILYIEELMDHINGSYSYMSNTPGMGMFKMASSSGGITNVRFDYVSLIRRPFHPIGKLSKLSLSFLTKDGNPYDFKGVNHQLLFAIKFRVPSQKETFTRSVLNPNYDADIMQYMAKNESIQYKEDSDDEEEFDDEKHYQTYRKELDKYDYSTSGDEEEEDEADPDTESSEENVDND